MAQVLYMATVTEAGHLFRAIDVLPVLAEQRLEKGIREFKGCGDNSDLSALLSQTKIREIRAGTFERV